MCRNEGFGGDDLLDGPHRGDPAPGLLMVSRPRVPRKAPAPWTTLIPRGGAKETRTPDPLLAKEVLYQLSYGPETGCAAFGAGSNGIIGPGGTRVGVSGLEPEASALSGQCSNQLS